MEKLIWRWRQFIKISFRSFQTSQLKIMNLILLLTVKFNVKLQITVFTSLKELWKWIPNLFHLVQRTCSLEGQCLEILKLPLESSFSQVTRQRSCKMQLKLPLSGPTLRARPTKLSSLCCSSSWSSPVSVPSLDLAGLWITPRESFLDAQVLITAPMPVMKMAWRLSII